MNISSMRKEDRIECLVIYLHCYWLLEFATLLDLEHKVPTIYILHHKVESVLQQNMRY
jgi:hypothetical protein